MDFRSASTPLQLCLLDDNAWVWDVFCNPLTDTFGAEPRFVLHDRQGMDQLVQELLSSPFDALLLDGALAQGMEGPDLLRLLRGTDAGLRCIGFSGDESYRAAFLDAGAKGFVYKRRDAPGQTVRALQVALRGIL